MQVFIFHLGKFILFLEDQLLVKKEVVITIAFINMNKASPRCFIAS